MPLVNVTLCQMNPGRMTDIKMGEVKMSTTANEPRVMSRVALEERSRGAVMAMLGTVDVWRIWRAPLTAAGSAAGAPTATLRPSYGSAACSRECRGWGEGERSQWTST